jgi:phospholipid/cholesterol/gamma-HCH transport system substrate-binding protein
MIVGVFVVLGICAFVWLVFKFGDLPQVVTKMDSFEVYIQFPTAPGVQRDTPVRFCGYQIGRVPKVMSPEIRKDKFTGLEYYQTMVILSIGKGYVNIPSNVDVKLMTRGLGSSYIELKQTPGKLAVPLDPNRPETKFLVDKILLQGSTGISSEFFPEESQEKLVELVESLRELSGHANDIISNPDTKANLHKIVANLADATEQAKLAIGEFRELAVAGTATLKDTEDKTEELVVAMVDVSEEMTKAAAQMRMILEKVNNGQGSVAKLVNDGRFYEELLENSRQLKLLLQEAKNLTTEFREKGIKVGLW